MAVAAAVDAAVVAVVVLAAAAVVVFAAGAPEIDYAVPRRHRRRGGETCRWGYS